jgi:hypothetical protein
MQQCQRTENTRHDGRDPAALALNAAHVIMARGSEFWRANSASLASNSPFASVEWILQTYPFTDSLG